MTKILSFALLFLFIYSFGQNISGYKNIFIPKQFVNENSNKFGLNDLLTKNLKVKKYNITDDASDFTCEMLKAEIEDISSSFKNKVKIDFKDCNNKTIASFEGKSNIKDFEPGMQDALKQALVIVPSSIPKISTRETTAEYLGKQDETDKIAVYKNNQKVFKKIKISSGRFILVNMENESIYATFSNSFKKEVFRVEMQNGAKTIGFQENNNLFIEVPFDDGRYRLEEFIIQ